ncbi:MAG TPA: hypothetical protein VIA63_04490 [Candidatus Limnocylindria bacterium]
MRVRAVVCGGREIADAAAVLGVTVVVDPSEAELALVDLRDPDGVARAAILPPDLRRVAVVGEPHVTLAGALGVRPDSIARSCEPALLGPLIAAVLPSSRRRATRSILFTTVRGGTGRTLLASNLARRLASGRSTVVLDLSADGTLAWWLGATPTSWADLESLVDELSAEHLGVVATDAVPGLRVVGGPPRAPSARLAHAALKSALDLAEMVLIDAPPLADERTTLLAGAVDRVLVTTYDDPVSVAAMSAADVPAEAWIIVSQSAATAIAGRDVFRALPRAADAIAAAAMRAAAIGGPLGRAYDELADLLAIDAE